jgi:hypothetical protein
MDSDRDLVATKGAGGALAIGGDDGKTACIAGMETGQPVQAKSKAVTSNYSPENAKQPGRRASKRA